MAEFRVVIDGPLAREHERAINEAIQRAVLPYIAGFGGDGPDDERPRIIGPHGPLPHRPWWGLIALPVPEEIAEQLKLKE